MTGGGARSQKHVRKVAKTLLDQMLAVATRFKDYNVRSYLARRAKDAFASMDAEKDDEGAKRFEEFAEKELKWMERQEKVYEMYGSARKSVVDDDDVVKAQGK